MSIRAKLYVGVVLSASLALFARQSYAWQTADPLRFLCYLTLTLLAAGVKVPQPVVSGAFSVFYVTILIGILQLGLPEVICLAAGAGVVQSLWRAQRHPRFVQLAFHSGCGVLAAAGSHVVYHALLTRLPAMHEAPAVGLAGTLYFLLGTIPVALLNALQQRQRLLPLWRERFYWSIPYYILGAAVVYVFEATTRASGWQTALLSLPVAYLLFRSYRTYVGRLEDEKTHAHEMAALHLRTIEALALAIDAKDHSAHDHLQRVEVYALELGRMMGLGSQDIQALQAAALLHDIGKLAVPEHIISKPGKLTAEEFEKMKIHPVVGAEILDRVKFPYPVVPIVRAHHEKWDGSGYPHGLRGEQIPLGARILSVVDCLDALVSDRQYRPALPLDKALAIVVSESGRSYDPQVVRLLQRHYLTFEEKAQQEPRDSDLARLSDRLLQEQGGEAPAAGLEDAGGDNSKTAPQADFQQSIAKAREEAQTLFELAQTLGNSLSLHDTLSVMAAHLKGLVQYDSVAIYVHEDGRLKNRFVDGDLARELFAAELPLGEGLCGWVAENRKPILNGNPAIEAGLPEVQGRGSRLHSAMAVPLETAKGIVGVLALYRRQADSFSRDELRVLLAVTSKLSVAVENSLRYARAESSATTDYMTSLPNARSLFLHLDSEVRRAAREKACLSILVCDLDGFKSVNDRFGHLAGNEVLAHVARDLRNVCRQYDYVARMGGDEFVIVLPGLTEDAVKSRLDEFQTVAVKAGIAVCGEQILGMSCGAASFPLDGADAESLLAEADRRMYQEKERRKGAARRSMAITAAIAQRVA